MFFCPELLKRRGGKFFLVWVAATQQGNALWKHLTPRKVRQVDIPSIVRDIIQILMNNYPLHLPRPLSSETGRFSLYLSSKLMYGSCVVHKKQAVLLFSDLHLVHKNLNELKWSEEKNAIVRQVVKSKKGKPGQDEKKSVKNGQTVQRAASNDLYIEVDLDELERSSTVGLEEPLIFSHSVPDSSITMREDVFSIRQDEDLSFGDEDNPLMLQLFNDEAIPSVNLTGEELEGPQPNGRVFPQVTEVFDEFGEPVFQTAEEDAIPSVNLTAEELEGPQPNGRAFPQVDEILEDLAQLPQFEPSDQSEFPPISTAAAPFQIDATTTVAEPRIIDILPESVPELSVAPVHAESPPEPDTLTLPGRAQDELCDEMLLPDIGDLRVGRRTKPKRRRLIIDSQIEIPREEFSNRIKSMATDTLRQPENFDNWLSRTKINLNAMRQPGRGMNINTGLMDLFTRHFSTRSEPTEEIPSHIRARRIIEERHESTVGTSQQVDVESSLGPLFDDHLSTTRDLERQGSIPTEAYIVMPPIPVEDPIAEVLPGPPSPKKRKLDVRDQVPRKTKRTSESNSLPEAKRTRHDEPEAAPFEMETSVTELLRTPERATTQLFEPELELPEDQPSPRRLLETTAVAPELEVPEEPTGGRRLSLSPGRPFEEEGTPRRRESSQSSTSLSPLTPAETILAKIREMCAEKDDNIISIDDLCPPEVRRRQSAQIFNAVIELNTRNLICLLQDKDGHTIMPLMITIRNEPDSVSLGD